MAKTRSPLFSASAHGKLARSLVYSKKKSGQLTRAMHYPKKEPSLKQWTRRHIVGLLTAHWQCMTDEEHATWNANSNTSDLNLPGYQYFLKLAQADLYSHHGLVCYFSFNELSGNTAYDYSGNSNNGILNPSYPDNCPTRVPGFRKEYGGALLFDGDDHYVRIPHDSTFDVTEEATFEAWIKPKDLLDDFHGIISSWLGEPDERCWCFRNRGRQIRFFFSDDGTNQWEIASLNRLTLEWTYVVARLDSSNKIRLFINAIKDPVEGDLTSFNTYPNDIIIGGVVGWIPFDGRIDEVRIYNRALSDEEIKKHYQLLRLDKKRQPLLRL